MPKPAKPVRAVWLYREAATAAKRLSTLTGQTMTAIVNDAVIRRVAETEPQLRVLYGTAVFAAKDVVPAQQKSDTAPLSAPVKQV